MGLDERPRPRVKRRVARVVLGAAGAVAIAWCAVWIVAPAGWALDVAAAFVFHAVLLAGIITIVSLLVRARLGTVLGCLAIGVGVFGLVRGRDLLPHAPPSGPVLRVLVYNAHADNMDHSGVIGVIRRSNAHVVVLIEPEVGLSRDIRAGHALAEEYPHWIMRDWVPEQISPILVLSRLPLDPVAYQGPEDERGYALAAVVDGPFGPVGVVAGQPLSPRTAARWHEGNKQLRTHAALIESLRARGLPVVFAADLNGSAASARGQTLSSAGVRACKPLLAPAGTFPASLPWPARISIDDAWHSDDLRVGSWQSLGPGGSDHEAVLIEVERDR